MASLHRIQWIDTCIRRGNYPNVDAIREQFEISRRQAMRDLEYMRDSLGAPIAYCSRRRGYYYEDESFVIPGPQITESEQEMLSSLAAHYEVLAQHNRRTTGTFTELAALLSRLSGRPLNLSMKIHQIQRDGIIPFQAVARLESRDKSLNSIPTSLQPYYRGRNEEQVIIFEFYDSYEFIPALLASGLTFVITHPKWLRHKLMQYLDRMHQLHRG
ncbi:hypothetical protein [Paenibacillus terrigena]|uniref:hypothetical protein n=1 Tax=Paenibacillus terrigena TaxID=369333 RepID=UPI00037136BC|nr:hypothetical protein [Paenibacillus terrigena]